jgi:N,N'-diacetyllegionaminate synthase
MHVCGFKIGTFTIDKNNDDDYCFVIAEAGSNHDQNKRNAFELVDVAAASGADAVKFQLFQAEKLYSRFVDREILERTRRSQLPVDWISEIMDRCKSQKITFLATPFDYESVDYLDRLGISAFKWASGEINDIELLTYTAKKQRPMILSTGMCNLADIEIAVDSVTKEKNTKLALLHCVSLYPTDAKDANLRMIDTLANAFGYPVGFSDHTLGIYVALAAVARGAKILEKHFTLDKKLKSPDHSFSLPPKELKQLIDSVREICLSLGSKSKHILDKEKTIARIARRSLIAAKPIKRGSVISKAMLSVKRPGTGIPPSLISLVVGKTTAMDIQNDQILTWSMLSQ